MTHQGTNPAERFKFAPEENEKQCIRDTSNFQRTKALAYLGETPSASQSRDLWRLSARRNPNVVNFPLKSPPSYCSNSHAPCTNDATMKPYNWFVAATVIPAAGFLFESVPGFSVALESYRSLAGTAKKCRRVHFQRLACCTKQ